MLKFACSDGVGLVINGDVQSVVCRWWRKYEDNTSVLADECRRG